MRCAGPLFVVREPSRGVTPVTLATVNLDSTRAPVVFRRQVLPYDCLAITPAVSFVNWRLFAVLAILPLNAGVGREHAATDRAVAPDRVEPNDNRQPAGLLRNGLLQLRLEARAAMWFPDGDALPGVSMQAFAEEGKPARIPGPLVRVPAGTSAEVSVHNTLPDTMLVYGLHTRDGRAGVADSAIVVAPGGRRNVRFRLDAAGTYFYWGTTTRRAFNVRIREDAQLTGAIVVDDSASGSAAARPTRDRIFVIGMWTDTVGRVMMRRERLLAVINGRSWPHTERLQYTVGDSVRWRIINGSTDAHPMHLHGFYFRIDSRGDGMRDTAYSPDVRQMAVTESMLGGTTRSITWTPERAGNWLFHCHVPEHFGARGSLGAKLAPAAAIGSAASHDNHATGGMNGMVLGIEVRPSHVSSARNSPARPVSGSGAERVMRLLVRPNRGSTGSVPLYGYTFHERGSEPAADSGLGFGPTLDLVRGQKVRITIVNRLAEPTAVHWHGIELESYYDGVPGFSGANNRLTPIIAAGDSFVVRFTPPRAGTFIYHTHAIEERQQLAGLAGTLIVSEPNAPRNPETDIPLVISAPSEFAAQSKIALVNGSSSPSAQVMRVGQTYRLRIVQMSVSRSVLRVEMLRDTTYSTWRAVAKDGAALPNAAQLVKPARAYIGIGETYDFEVTPTLAGAMRLEVRVGQPWPGPSVLLTTLPISVVLESK